MSTLIERAAEAVGALYMASSQLEGCGHQVSAVLCHVVATRLQEAVEAEQAIPVGEATESDFATFEATRALG